MAVRAGSNVISDAFRSVANFIQNKNLAGYATRSVKMEGNKAINSINYSTSMFGGIESSYRNIVNNKMGIREGISQAHRHADGTINAGAVAGSYLGVSTAGRVASGGGVHKDRHGRSNIIGVPFI